MKASLQLKTGQRLTMTPQLQHAIRLLQMSGVELVTEIQNAVEANPLLEEVDSDFDAEDATNTPSGVDREEPSRERDDEGDDEIRADDGIRQAEVSGDKLLDTDYDALFDPAVTPAGNKTGDAPSLEFAERRATPTDLRHSLLQQLTTRTRSSSDMAIAQHLIDAIDDRGYLTVNVDEVASLMNQSIETAQHTIDESKPTTTVAEVEAVLKLIQNFEPEGVGARDLRECLMIQLRHISQSKDNTTAELLHLAECIVDNALEALGERDLARLKRETGAKDTELGQAIALIKSLNPCPGDAIETNTTEYIIPDLFVLLKNGRWVVQLNQQTIPRVQLNMHYASFKKSCQSRDDSEFLKEHETQAKWFLKSLNNRHDTLLRVGREIVKRQTKFFNDGAASMRPMVLADIASALDLHESTISRATTQKFMQTPIGVFELKYFFSSALSGDSGETHSSTAIRSLIRKMVDDEPSDKPLSDNKIATILSEQGINVARRTVAKYRESMNIPPSSQRKRLS